ncbi:MAG: hypothetical protein IPG71_12145 [bacterium]|nr:hypothetical protein [bacterium]
MCNAYGTIGYSRGAFIHDLLGVPRDLAYDRPIRMVRPTDLVPVIRSTGAKFEQIELRWGAGAGVVEGDARTTVNKCAVGVR